MEKEEILKAYFKAWEQKDWNSAKSLLDENFRFTSPLNDGISLEEFEKSCWPESEKINRFTIKNIAGHNDIVFVKYECLTTEDKTFQNTELFVFKEEKIKSVEVFFGRGQGYPFSNRN